MNRRGFLRSLVATAAGVLVAEDVLELLEPSRRIFPVGIELNYGVSPINLFQRELDKVMKGQFAYMLEQIRLERKLLDCFPLPPASGAGAFFRVERRA